MMMASCRSGTAIRVTNPMQELVSYLATAGLLTKPCNCLILTATNRSSSHSVVDLKLRNGQRWIVKRARARTEAPGPPTLGAEFAAYRLRSELPALACLMPECLHVDEATQTLVLQGTKDEGTFHPTPQRCARLGKKLAAMHRSTEGGVASGFTDKWPWILDVFEPHGFQTPVAKALVEDTAAVGTRLRLLGTAVEMKCLVHNDVKFANCLAGDGPEETIHLIDWETAGIGDPAWDVAGVVQDHLQMALRGANGPDVRAALTAFLRAYLEAYAPEDGRAFRMKISGMTGARLLQSSFENALSCGVSAHARVLADHAARLLQRPESLFDVFRRAA